MVRLFEVTQRNVAPNVAVKVDQDGIKAGDGVKQLGDVVVWFDLSGVGLKDKPSEAIKAWALACQSMLG